MTLAAARVAEVRRERQTLAVQGLQARSPLATLARGYAIVTRLPDGLILRDAAQAPPGTQVRARVADGELICRVEEDRRIGDPRAES
jgi:exodeoxyribonuclease VII large subunit